MVEWKSRLVILLIVAAAFAVAFGMNYGWFNYGW